MTPAPCPECGQSEGHLPACRAEELDSLRKAAAYAIADVDGGTSLVEHADNVLALLDEVAALRARVAELEAQHDGNGDAFASGRRYERTYAGLRVRALEQVVDRVRAELSQARERIDCIRRRRLTADVEDLAAFCDAIEDALPKVSP